MYIYYYINIQQINHSMFLTHKNIKYVLYVLLLRL